MNYTLEEIRAALPTHIMLTPGKHIWREGDEILGAKYIDTSEPTWISPVESAIGSVIKSRLPCRRAIPPHILDNQAYWVWYGQFTGKAEGWPVSECGGLQAFSAHFARGLLYDKWLLEQMEGV